MSTETTILFKKNNGVSALEVRMDPELTIYSKSFLTMFLNVF